MSQEPNQACIVLIEDNAADVYLIEKALRHAEVAFDLVRFRDGEEGLKALTSAYLTVPDLILLDLNLPRSDGMDVLRRLRQTPRLANVPVAILTSSGASSDKHRSALLGAVRYIQKPTGLDEFLDTVGGSVREILQCGSSSVISN
jgi:CheY-like chemotaxis protein